MKRQTITVSSAASSAAIPMDPKVAPFSVGIGCVATGTLTYKVQHTFDDIFDSTVTPTWFDHSSMTGLTANQDGNYAYAVRGVRLLINSGTGSVTMNLVQSSTPSY